MEQRNIEKINTKNINKRYAVSDIEKFIDSDAELDGRILVLYGLRRTGKTTMMEQIIEKYRDTQKCAFYEVTDKDTMDDIRDALISEQEKGVSIICFDEITKAKDFITSSAILPDIFAKEGIKIIVAGTDSLGFVFAEDTELFDRTTRIRTTHIPFAEHCDILGINDIDDYIMYGGLMRKGQSDKQIYDYMSAKKYLDSAVSGNISSSIKNDPHNNDLQKLTVSDIRTIIEKMVEIYSGIFNVKQMQENLSKVSVNGATDMLLKTEYREYLKPVSLNKRNITNDFVKVINADKIISTQITDNMVLEFERYLIEMDLLSAINKIRFYYTDELGWMESPVEKDFYIIQPAIKYYHLQKGKEFIQESQYYAALPQEVKEKLQTKLDEQIKGLMTEEIIVFDTTKSLDQEHYFVCKPEFYMNGQKRGEYDMLIYDKKANKYWAFEIKHTTNPYYKQEEHLQNDKLKEVIMNKYGECQNVCVLYRGEPCVSDAGTIYLNITDFLRTIYEFPNLDVAFSRLTDSVLNKENGKVMDSVEDTIRHRGKRR